MRVQLFGVDDRAALAAALELRFSVFVVEQRVPAAEEIDEHDRSDAAARHALIRDESGTVLATGRYFRLDERSVQIGRMAVRAEDRGRGVGRALLDALAADARARGYRRAALNAQDHAVGFYAKAGFTPFGAALVECDIVHQPMEKDLSW